VTPDYNIEAQQLRTAIGTYFMQALRAPHFTLWGGKVGVISSLINTWNLPKNSRRYVKHIIQSTVQCINNKVSYHGLTKRNESGGRPQIIQQGSVEEGIIAEWMEAGLGFRFTTLMVNQHRIDEGNYPIGRNAVMNHFDRMRPKITKIQKCCQANSNNEKWVLARFNQCKQYLIMFGKITLPTLMEEYSHGTIPKEFDPEQLPKVSIDQIIWYDETHIQQEGGRVSRGGVQIRFPRDANGAFSSSLDEPTDEMYSAPLRKPVFKYAKEARFCLGVGVVKDAHGEYIGKKTQAFSYTMKTIVSIKSWDTACKQEYNRVKKIDLKGLTSPWIVDTRPNDKIVYEDDLILRLPGLGKTAYNRIVECDPNIKTIKDLKQSTNTNLNNIRGIKKFLDTASKALPETCPYPIIDHRMADNPYLSRYGDTWETELKHSSALSPYVCITDLIMYMCEESQKLMNGTAHEHSWYFYHDALNFSTMNQTKEWMKQTHFNGKSIYSRWLIPQNDLNKHTTYHDRPVGNSPEFMPLDNSLNNDIKSSHYHHCAVTAHLPINDNRRHSMATPKTIDRGIRRIWDNPDGPPSSKRIVHDCIQAIEAMALVYKAKGSIVPGLCNRNGNRYDRMGTLQHGGARVKKETITSDIWLEPLAASAFENRKDFIKSRYIMALEDDMVEMKDIDED
jgi:hypothetical protein